MKSELLIRMNFYVFSFSTDLLVLDPTDEDEDEDEQPP